MPLVQGRKAPLPRIFLAEPAKAAGSPCPRVLSTVSRSSRRRACCALGATFVQTQDQIKAAVRAMIAAYSDVFSSSQHAHFRITSLGVKMLIQVSCITFPNGLQYRSLLGDRVRPAGVIGTGSRTGAWAAGASIRPGRVNALVLPLPIPDM